MHQLSLYKWSGVQLSDPRKLQKCAGFIKEQLLFHKTVGKVHLLKKANIENWLDEDIYLCEKLDQLNFETMIHAEKIFTKNCSKRYDWSPALVGVVSL